MVIVTSFWRRLIDRLARVQLPAVLRQGPAEDAAVTAAGLVRAGDIARDARQRHEALVFYGRAIDAYLAAGRHRDAESVCRGIIAMEPEVIRTRYTLTAIAVGRGKVRQTRERLSDYMDAVTRSQAAAQAVPSLLELAAATSDSAVRRLIADALTEAGRPDLGEQVAAGTAATPTTPGWDQAVHAAFTRPDEVDVEALTAS